MTTLAPLPLQHVPRGLTVVPSAHRGDYEAAWHAFRDLATRHLGDVDEALLAVIWGQLFRQHIRPLCEQVDAAHAAARTAQRQALELEAELRQRRDAEAAALLRRRLQAERRDRTLCESVRQRDGDQCRYCGIDVQLGGRGGAVLDHIVPDLAGGADNLATCCRPCRRKKGSRSPEAAGMALRLPPLTPRFLPDPSTREEPMAPIDESQPGRQPGIIRITVTYPAGPSAHIEWSGIDTEPTPDELAEVVTTLMRELAPAQVTVEGAASTVAAGRDQHLELLAEYAELLDAAWGVIANAMNVGDPPVDPAPGWHAAATRWRDRYHEHLDRLKMYAADAAAGAGLTPCVATR